MRHQFSALVLLGGCLLAAPAAWADTTHIVDKISITGNKTVSTDKLMAVVQSHAGSPASNADIVADQDAIVKVLGASNVVGGIQTRLITKPNKHIEVVFVVNDQGAQAPIVNKVAPKLETQTVEGNTSLDSGKLIAATGLKAGDDLSNEKIAAAQAAIAKAYKDGKPTVGVNVTGDIKTISGGKVDITWHVVETKAKKKPRNIGERGLDPDQ